MPKQTHTTSGWKCAITQVPGIFSKISVHTFTGLHAGMFGVEQMAHGESDFPYSVMGVSY